MEYQERWQGIPLPGRNPILIRADAARLLVAAYNGQRGKEPARLALGRVLAAARPAYDQPEPSSHPYWDAAALARCAFAAALTAPEVGSGAQALRVAAEAVAPSSADERWEREWERAHPRYARGG